MSEAKNYEIEFFEVENDKVRGKHCFRYKDLVLVVDSEVFFSFSHVINISETGIFLLYHILNS